MPTFVLQNKKTKKFWDAPNASWTANIEDAYKYSHTEMIHLKSNVIAELEKFVEVVC